MKHRKKRESATVIYDISVRCLELDEFSGFFSSKKKKRLYESIMNEISCAVLKLFNEVETFSFAVTGEGFHILIWAIANNARMSSIMAYVQGSFTEKVNRYLDRTGPVWDGRWTCDVINEPDID